MQDRQGLRSVQREGIGLEVHMQGIWGHDKIVQHLGECRQSVVGWVSGDHGGYSHMVMCKIAKGFDLSSAKVLG